MGENHFLVVGQIKNDQLRQKSDKITRNLSFGLFKYDEINLRQAPIHVLKPSISP